MSDIPGESIEPKYNNLELRGIFGTDDLLSIIGITNKEDYHQYLVTKKCTAVRLAYLRSVVRNHPSSSGCAPDTLEEAKETFIRSKKLYVMNDIFNYLISTVQSKVESREEYFRNGIVPDLPSLLYLRSHPFKLDSYEVPPFEEVAADLKTLFLEQMKSIREMQQAMLSSSSTDG